MLRLDLSTLEALESPVLGQLEDWQGHRLWLHYHLFLASCNHEGVVPTIIVSARTNKYDLIHAII